MTLVAIDQLGGPDLIGFLAVALALVVICIMVLVILVVLGVTSIVFLVRRRPLKALATIVIGSAAVALLGILLYDGSTALDKVVAAVALIISIALFAVPARQAAQRAAADAVRDVFLCHVSEDKEAIARPIAVALGEHGIDYWIDEAEMRWGDRIRDKIDEGIKSCRYVLVIVTRNLVSKKSEWVQKEMLTSLASELALNRPTVLPLLADAEWGEFTDNLGKLIGEKHVLRWRGDGEEVAREVAHLLAKESTN